MSRRSTATAALCALLLSTATGCWEQWSETWFPQMKWQKAVQAFERVEWQGRVEGFVPPEGTVPVTGAVPSYDRFDPRADSLRNPTSPTDFRSLQKGQAVYEANCAACHGLGGGGDGPVSGIRYPDRRYDAYPEPVRPADPSPASSPSPPRRAAATATSTTSSATGPVACPTTGASPTWTAGTW